LLASVRHGAKNDRGVVTFRKVILDVPFDVPHPFHEYTPLYALRRRTKGSFDERFWEWTWEKRIEAPVRLLSFYGAVNLALVLAVAAQQQITGRRFNCGEIAQGMLIATMIGVAGQMIL